MKFEKRIQKLIDSDDGSREYQPVYLAEGDCLVYYSSDTPCHRVRLDGLVTVYVSDENPEEFVGCEIKGVRRMMEQYGSFRIELGQPGRSLGFFFMAAGLHPSTSSLARNLFESDLARREVDLPELVV